MWLINVAKQPCSRPLHIRNAMFKRRKALSPQGRLSETALTLRVSGDSTVPVHKDESCGLSWCQHAGGHLARHSRNERRASTAPFFWLDEGNFAVRSHFPHKLMEPLLETERENLKVKAGNIHFKFVYIKHHLRFPLNFPPHFPLFAFPLSLLLYTHRGCSL